MNLFKVKNCFFSAPVKCLHSFSSRHVFLFNKERDEAINLEITHRLKKPTDEKLYQWASSISGHNFSEFFCLRITIYELLNTNTPRARLPASISA
jgi:hypothetical protein